MRLDNDPDRWISPIKYLLHYSRIDLDKFTFQGSVDITVAVVSESTKTIRLHSIDLHVRSARVTNDHGEMVEASRLEVDAPNESVYFYFDQDIADTSHVVVEFEGSLSDNLAGLYRSFYTNQSGEKRAMAVTQFEPTDARRAFPCMDDPALKAVFQVQVCTHADRLVISNTQVISVSSDKEWKLWKFAATPVMSTYLLAWVVGEFDKIVDYTDRGIETTVYTPLGRSEEGQFAMNVAKKALSFFEKEYGVNYPLKKQDLLAIPDFAAGAMENWGMVTYREARLLTHTTRSSTSQKLSVARVVSHELAHQWFGNLVTMEFWTDLWLNEGFARFMEFASVNSIYPEWNSWTIFVQNIQSLALHLDSLDSTHPVRVEVQNADQINSIFDAISYAKGASIIRMIEEYLGHASFMLGVKYYLQKFAYSNAETNDLWDCMELANELEKGTISNLMSSWTSNSGYPLITVKSSSSKIESLEIQRFCFNTDSSTDTRGNWIVPIRLISTGINETFLIPRQEKELVDKLNRLDNAEQWFTLNGKSSGFYRVSYTKKQWGHLGEAFIDESNISGESDISVQDQGNELPCIDRVGLVRDAFCLAASGYVDIGVPLSLCMAILPHFNERNAFVLMEFLSRLKVIAAMYENEPFFQAFAQQILLPCCSPLLDRLGWAPNQDEDGQIGVLRAQVLEVLALVPDSECTSIAKSMVTDHFAGVSLISPDLRSTVFSLAIRDKTDPAQLMQKFEFASEDELNLSSEERRECLMAVAQFSKHPSLTDAVVQFTLNGQLRLQDFAGVLSTVCKSSPAATSIVWDKLCSDYDTWLSTYGAVGMQWGSTVGGIVAAFETQAELTAVELFFQHRDLGAAERGLQSALERVKGKIDRKKREMKQLEELLQTSS